MNFTCPQCGGRNSQFQDCGCDVPEDQDAAGDAEADEADHHYKARREER